ncbi:hypothetical protein HHUSO_G33512 [Huso huso]|uniref:Uncharacterized protein n=1 Tax=Huso huso TaxID=61971 RepID=A0ABR0Y8D4_HUSHU
MNCRTELNSLYFVIGIFLVPQPLRSPVLKAGRFRAGTEVEEIRGLPYLGESQATKMESVYIKQEEVLELVPICIKTGDA